MAFTDLNINLQNILIQEYSDKSKFIFFIFFLVLSAFYVFYIWKNHKKTPFVTQAIFRIVFYVMSIVYLVGALPLYILLSPELSFWQFLNIFLVIYGICLAIFFVIGLIDFLRVGIMGTLQRAGLDFKDSNISEIVSRLSRNKHGIK